MVQPVLVALIALLLEAAIGYPSLLYRLVRHPVSWFGALIDGVDRLLNRDAVRSVWRRLAGVLAILIIVGVPVLTAVIVQRIVFGVLPTLAALGVLGILAATLPAQRSLHSHVLAVAVALEQGGATEGRRAVAMIVGRETAVLDEAGIARAAIESLAENFSDGVVAPLFWCALLGLPGIVLYKAINTADSMIGHRTPRFAAFGWASARLDDLVNLPASRLSALWIVLAVPDRMRTTLGAIRRDAGRHRSPNAGWPEAAMAGALGVRLAGPRVYHGQIVEDAWMGDGGAECGTEEIRRALAVFRRACAIQAAALLAILAAIAPRCWA